MDILQRTGSCLHNNNQFIEVKIITAIISLILDMSCVLAVCVCICVSLDDDCNHEIKRCLLLGRRAMTNLDSILKSRDITLPTKVHLVKAMVFPVVMYGYETWTVKKAEH